MSRSNLLRDNFWKVQYSKSESLIFQTAWGNCEHLWLLTLVFRQKQISADDR